MTKQPVEAQPAAATAGGAGAAAPGLRPGERRLAMIGVMLCMFLGALDQTIVATAMPRVVEELHGLDRYAWVATAYLLATVVALPIFGRLNELLPGKWVFTAAAGIFLAGSALCGLSPSMDALIAFRALQGIGGGGLFATSITTIGLLYPPRERGRVQGVFAAVFGLSSVVGPWVGGLLTDHLDWRWVFYVNMPVGIVALYFLLRHMPLLPPLRRSAFDLPGAVAMALWTVPLILACSWGGSTYPWGSPQVLGLFALAAVGLVLFVVVERRSAQPLFDLSLFANPTFRWAVLALLFFGGTFLGSVMFLPLYLVQVKGFSASNSGLALTPLTFGTMAGSLLAGQLATRFGRYKPMLLVSSVGSVALFLVFHEVLRVDTPLWQVLVLMVLLGFFFGPSMPLYGMAVQNSVSRERIGTASSATQFFRQVGSTVAVALLGTVLSGALHQGMIQHLPPAYRAATQSIAMPAEGMAGGVDLEVRVRQGFEAVLADVERALRGDEQAYARLQADPRVPADLKEQLPKGGIRARVRERVGSLKTALATALEGDERARQALLADPALPASLRRLVEHPPADPGARRAALAAAQQALDAQVDAMAAQAEEQAIAQIRRAMEQQVDQAVAAFRAAFNEAVTEALRQVYLYTAAMAVMGLCCLFFLPDEELKRGYAQAEPMPAPARQ
ncbi:MDR family MFS transporter [Thermaerobacter composti]|uniref:MDR family MFS transporter n=1 Tax=Thermaerobacter composti TaxID=554949 RepID=A0ABZ0QPX6_9FIRM|nr:MDR family MFS transporter [Thermaerobacter composti]PZN07774.1 MAG: MFS transporter [Bacillota bacterium]WPD19531.1 MDR family MFS transporter [Thermaerobacter composti]